MKSQIMNKTVEIMEITKLKLCNRCLGRQFSKSIDAPDNKHRGEFIKQILTEEGYHVQDVDSCYICNNIFHKIKNGLIENIIKKIDGCCEFSTFLVGCRLREEIIQKEEQIQREFNLDTESIKKEINREIGKKLSKELNVQVDFENPDIVVIVDFINNDIHIQINPLFIEGRYRKLVRGIPQTKWPCKKCKGKGGENCNHTGKMYQESVEELISEEAIRATRGTATKFHGAGREDVDVRMLGNGRPFVLEIKEPKIRNIDLDVLEDKINRYGNKKVEVSNLKFADKERCRVIKNSSRRTYKMYQAIVELEDEIKEGNLKLLDSLRIVNQRTPLRVSHRRADKIRTRKIKKIQAKKISPRTIEMIIECEGGLYIKELISGDQHRTRPSVSEVLKMDAKCTKLDVLDVKLLEKG